MSYIVKCDQCEPSIDSFHILRSYLPEEYEYMVCSFTINGPNFKTRLRTSGKNQDYAQKWLEDFQMHSKCTMRVERTYPHSGTKNVFKIDLRCQHNTRPRSDKVREKDSCKNTDCPAKMGITIKRVVTERKSRSKDPHLPSYPTVLQLDFCHNHPISTPEILRHRSVLPEVKGKIINLFKLGHNPTTALDMHKYDLQLEHGENYSKIYQDRALLPDPQFCYRLYYKIIRKQAMENGETIDADSISIGPDDDIDVKPQNSNFEKTSNDSSMEEALNDCINDTNGRKLKKKRKLDCSFLDKNKMATQLEDVLCKFCESGGFAGMQIIDDNTVMALCTPLMHRVHTLVKQSAELVFVDAYGELDEPNACRVLMFVTYSCAGALPLGCLVTTSTSVDCIKAALDLWKQVLPDGCFYGKSEGPQIFLTNDCEAEKQSLKAAFPQSHLLVCISHILQSSWIFLWDRKNAIKKEHRSLLFSKVKMLLFSQTVDELEMNYAYSMQDNLVKTYPVFMDHLSNMYNQRHDWSLVYRRHLLSRADDISIFWEVAMILLKDPILSRTRTFNQLQIIDFLSRLDTYYERCLIDIANSRLDSVKNSRFLFIEMPQEAYTITQKSESEYEVHNDTKDTTYQLDITLGMCECRTGKNGAPCKHQLLVFRNFVVPSYDCLPISAQNEKALLFHLATGQKLENGTSVDTTNDVPNLLTESCSDITMHDLAPCSQSSFFLTENDTCESLDHSTILNHNGMNSHGPPINQHSITIPTVSPHMALNPHTQSLPSQPMPLEHHTHPISHQANNMSHHTVSQIPSNVIPMQHSSTISQTTVPQQSQILQLTSPPPPPPPPPPPLPIPEISSSSQNPSQTVHELIDQTCKKLKERTTRLPQTFIPALDTFLKNLDKLSSDSSLEYALYSFGKFSKSAMPLFKRKVVNNKLVGLQSAGDLKKKVTPVNRVSKIVENNVPH